MTTPSHAGTSPPKVGDIVEAFCSQCKLNLDASVAAVVGDEIVSVVCRTCDETQRYKPPQPIKPSGRRVVDVAPRRKKKSSRSRGGPTLPLSGGRGAAPERQAPRKRTKRKPTDEEKRSQKLLAEWEEATEATDSRYARPHRVEESYDIGEAILDHKLGMGIVESVGDDGTLKVLFRDGRHELESTPRSAQPDPATA